MNNTLALRCYICTLALLLVVFTYSSIVSAGEPGDFLADARDP